MGQSNFGFGALVRLAALALLWIVVAVIALSALYRVVTPPSTPMLARYLAGQPTTRVVVPFKRFDPDLVRAVVVSEDARFCFHSGIDWTELRGQIDRLLSDGGRPRGASTLTMQLARNLFLWTGRSYLRKGLELPLAVWLDFVLGKQRILELYLNVAEWGNGVFGAEAAARAAFGVDAEALTQRQAALLATALPNPRRRNPAAPGAWHSERADVIARRAARAGGLLDCIGL